MQSPDAPLTTTLTASEALEAIRDGRLTHARYLESCLADIARHESSVHAFAYLDAAAASNLDARLVQAPVDGALRGIPIAVKDVLETASMPTEFNSPLYEGHVAARDAACVAVLKAHGAFVLGKTTTVEFASLGQIPPTRNPHDLGHTPGGTSSGSAVAVATGMAPIALGTQTGGSTIRPASFCGVAAMKPTWGLVSTEGLKPYAPSLDTISWMARSVADLRLVLACFHPDDIDSETGEKLRIGYYRTPYWDKAESATRDALERTVELLEGAGAEVRDIDVLPEEAGLYDAQDTVMHAEGRRAFLAEYLHRRDELHPELGGEVENVAGIDAARLKAAYDYLGRMRNAVEDRMESYDAWLTPAVPGEAPRGLDSTGDAVFNRLWTGLHAPAVTLPGFRGDNGLPVGIQLVAPRFADDRLLAVAAVVESLIATRP